MEEKPSYSYIDDSGMTIKLRSAGIKIASTSSMTGFVCYMPSLTEPWKLRRAQMDDIKLKELGWLSKVLLPRL